MNMTEEQLDSFLRFILAKNRAIAANQKLPVHAVFWEDFRDNRIPPYALMGIR